MWCIDLFNTKQTGFHLQILTQKHPALTLLWQQTHRVIE